MKKILMIAPASYPVNGAEAIVNIKLLKALSDSGKFEIDLISKKNKKKLLKLILFIIISVFMYNFVNVCVKILSKTEKIRQIDQEILSEKEKNIIISEKLQEVEKNSDQTTSEDNSNNNVSNNIRIFENIVQ